MAFRKVATQVKYPLAKGNTVKKGDVLVTEGVFVGTKASPTYPNSPTFHFEQRVGGEMVGLNGGHLTYLEEKGMLKLGKCYNVIYDGWVTLEKGPMKGKNAHTFALEEDDAPAVAIAGVHPEVSKSAQGSTAFGDDITL